MTRNLFIFAIFFLFGLFQPPLVYGASIADSHILGYYQSRPVRFSEIKPVFELVIPYYQRIDSLSPTWNCISDILDRYFVKLRILERHPDLRLYSTAIPALSLPLSTTPNFQEIKQYMVYLLVQEPPAMDVLLFKSYMMQPEFLNDITTMQCAKISFEAPLFLVADSTDYIRPERDNWIAKGLRSMTEIKDLFRYHFRYDAGYVTNETRVTANAVDAPVAIFQLQAESIRLPPFSEIAVNYQLRHLPQSYQLGDQSVVYRLVSIIPSFNASLLTLQGALGFETLAVSQYFPDFWDPVKNAARFHFSAQYPWPGLPSLLFQPSVGWVTSQSPEMNHALSALGISNVFRTPTYLTLTFNAGVAYIRFPDRLRRTIDGVILGSGYDRWEWQFNAKLQQSISTNSQLSLQFGKRIVAADNFSSHSSDQTRVELQGLILERLPARFHAAYTWLAYADRIDSQGLKVSQGIADVGLSIRYTIDSHQQIYLQYNGFHSAANGSGSIGQSAVYAGYQLDD